MPLEMAKRPVQSLGELHSDASRLAEDLEKETDRGAALLGAAFLDDVLDALLTAAFVDEPDVVGRLMGGGRPLESFGARAHLAYAMGLLGIDVYADINVIREIRNDFAHRKPMSFKAPGVREKCQRLCCVEEFLGGNVCSARQRFIASVILLVNHLMMLVETREHVSPAPSFARGGVLRVR